MDKRIQRAKRLAKARNIKRNNISKKTFRWIEMPQSEVTQSPTVCELCHGEGKVSYDEQVYPNEPHIADTGTMPCPMCAINSEIELEYEK